LFWKLRPRNIVPYARAVKLFHSGSGIHTHICLLAKLTVPFKTIEVLVCQQISKQSKEIIILKRH
jgi:hypothetical protein